LIRPTWLKQKIEATVDVSTINTGIGARNKHLQAEEYFNAEKYPQIKISSTSITIIDEATKKAHMDGTLTIKGKEKPCSLDFIYSKSEKGYNLKSDFTVNRKDFGVGSKKTRIMKDKVEVSLDINVE